MKRYSHPNPRVVNKPRGKYESWAGWKRLYTRAQMEGLSNKEAAQQADEVMRYRVASIQAKMREARIS